jgi:hypothetical protein
MGCIFLTDAERKEYFLRILESINREGFATTNVDYAWRQLKQFEKFLSEGDNK